MSTATAVQPPNAAAPPAAKKSALSSILGEGEKLLEGLEDNFSGFTTAKADASRFLTDSGGNLSKAILRAAMALALLGWMKEVGVQKPATA